MLSVFEHLASLFTNVKKVTTTKSYNGKIPRPFEKNRWSNISLYTWTNDSL